MLKDGKSDREDGELGLKALCVGLEKLLSVVEEIVRGPVDVVLETVEVGFEGAWIWLKLVETVRAKVGC